jgi:hypothetical protein
MIGCSSCFTDIDKGELLCDACDKKLKKIWADKWERMKDRYWLNPWGAWVPVPGPMPVKDK